MKPIENLNYYGLKVSVFDEQQLEDNIRYFIDNKITKVFYGYSFASIPYFKKTPQLYLYANSFDVLVNDGRVFYLFGRMLGFKFHSDISIPNLVFLILNIANKQGSSIMLLGGTEEVNKKATQNIRENYPGIRVIEGLNGYYPPEKEPEIADLVRAQSPDILLIGISSPKKERFAYRYKNNLGSSIIVPCGGVIDILAGKVKLSPRIIKKLGLASFYRIAQEPRRLFLLHSKILMIALFRIMPYTILKVKLLKDKDFSFPGMYGLENLLAD